MVDSETLSYNTRGLGNERKRRKIFNHVKKHTNGKAAVFLQETYSTKKHENLWKYQWHGDMTFSHGTSGIRGVYVAFRYNLEYKCTFHLSDKEGRYIILHIEIQGTLYILIKGELQRENKLILYERAFRLLENDMHITVIGQAILELLGFKVGSGNDQTRISLLQKFSEIFGNIRLISPKMTSYLTSHNLQILKIDIFSKPCKIRISDFKK